MRRVKHPMETILTIAWEFHGVCMALTGNQEGNQQEVSILWMLAKNHKASDMPCRAWTRTPSWHRALARKLSMGPPVVPLHFCWGRVPNNTKIAYRQKKRYQFILTSPLEDLVQTLLATGLCQMRLNRCTCSPAKDYRRSWYP